MERITRKIGVDHRYDLDIYVELSEDDSLNRDFAEVAFSVIREFTKIYSCPLPAGMRSIRIFYRSEGPITDSTSDVSLYQIGLNPECRCYDQLAYQLGHELCHILSDPRRSNWFVESCCEMMSQLLLFRLSESWINEPPFPNWANYAPKFLEYAKNIARQWRIDEFGKDRPPTQDEIVSIKESLQSNPRIRSKNGIIAEILLPIFKKSLDNLKALPFLGKASDSPPLCLKDFDSECKIVFKFERWEEAVPDEDLKRLVKEVKEMFEK